MAENKWYNGLQRLFSTGVVVRRIGKGKLKVVDTSNLQAAGGQKGSKVIDRYGRIYNSRHISYSYGRPGGRYPDTLNNRLELYTDYEAMATDAILSSALDIYSDECLQKDTIIPLLDGKKITIKELFDSKEKDFWLYGLDDAGNFKPIKAEKVSFNGTKKIYKITLEDGTELKATGNHVWLNTDRIEKRTDELVVGDGIYTILSDQIKSNHKIIKIEEYGFDEVYDIVNAGDNHVFAIETKDGGKLYTHNCSTRDLESGDILNIKSKNENTKQILENLFYDILNIDHNLWWWIRNLVKYGDFYLQLNLNPEYGVINAQPLSSYDVIREEYYDDESNQFKVKFIYQGADRRGEFQYFEIAHFRMLTDSNFLPYGKSMMEGARKTWKQLVLMEDAMLINRIMRAPERRIIRVDIGNLKPDEVDGYMEKVMNKMKKVPYIDESTGEINLKFNLMNMLEDVFLAVRGDKSGTTIDTLPGLEWNTTEDIEYLRNKLISALKIPKAFLGYEKDIEGKATLATLDVRFTRTIEMIQRIVVSELTKIAIIHLFLQGYKDADLVEFDLELTNPSIIYEQEKVSLLSEKYSLVGTMQNTGITSLDKIYKDLFDMSEDDIKAEKKRILDDYKWKFRLTQIETEGNDPAISGESYGTPHDLAAMSAEEGEEEPQKPDINIPKKKNAPGQGRPEEPTHYGAQEHPDGRDPLAKKDIEKSMEPDPSPLKHNFRNSPLALQNAVERKNKKMITELYKEKEEDSDFLDENNIKDD